MYELPPQLEEEMADLGTLYVLIRTYPFDRLGPITRWPSPIALLLKRIASRRARRLAEMPEPC